MNRKFNKSPMNNQTPLKGGPEKKDPAAISDYTAKSPNKDRKDIQIDRRQHSQTIVDGDNVSPMRTTNPARSNTRVTAGAGNSFKDNRGSSNTSRNDTD